MLNTIENNSVVLIDPDQETEVIAKLLLEFNAFVSIKTVETITTLDKITQYRMRKVGKFPKLICLTPQGRRKAYRLKDIQNWLENPFAYYRNPLSWKELASSRK